MLSPFAWHTMCLINLSLNNQKTLKHFFADELVDELMNTLSGILCILTKRYIKIILISPYKETSSSGSFLDWRNVENVWAL